MKRTFLAGISFVIIATALVFSQPAGAQPTPAPSDQPAPTPAPTPAPAPAPRPVRPFQMPPNLRRGMRPELYLYMHTLGDLRQVRISLQHSTNDFAGHRESAAAAVDKAIEELDVLRHYAQTNGIRMTLPPKPIASPDQRNLAAPAPPPGAPAPQP